MIVRNLLMLLFCATMSSIFAQGTCIDYKQYTGQNFNDTTVYPIGSALFTNGDLTLFKAAGTFNLSVIGVTDTSMTYVGSVGIDVSADTSSCKRLIFRLIGNSLLEIDGDSIDISTQSIPYQGSGFQLTNPTGNTYVVEGTFNQVINHYSTSILYEVCLNACYEGDCIDFKQYTTQNFNDTILYPIGSTLLSEGDVRLIKERGSMNFYAFGSTDTSITYMGSLGIDVSSSNYVCKRLSFDLVGNSLLDIDGDSIDLSTQAFPYIGNGFTVKYVGTQTYIVEGSFNKVINYYSTSVLANVCLEACEEAVTCIDYRQYSGQDFNDTAIYPIGASLFTNGDIHLVKDQGIMPLYIVGTTDTSITYVGSLGIDVSSSSYSCKKLSFYLGGNTLLVIDGDSVDVMSQSLPYQGNGFTVSSFVAYEYVIEGDFSTVVNHNSTSILGTVCLEDCGLISSVESLVEQRPGEYRVYPNPSSNGIFYLERGHQDFERIEVYGLRGNLLEAFLSRDLVSKIDLSSYAKGIYIIRTSSKQRQKVFKVIKS